MIKIKQKDIQGMVIAVVLIGFGGAALWNTTSMLDADSYIFPRFIIVVMICLCTTLIIRQTTSPDNKQADNKQKDESSLNEVFSLRSLSLVIAMLVGALLMPFIGFISSSFIIFFVLVGCSMYDPWTLTRKIVYPLVGIFIILVVYFIFVYVLLVPLPSGTLFD